MTFLGVFHVEILHAQYNSDIVGLTWYDLQTNASVQNRLYIFDDGSAAATWTMGFSTPTFPDRGTGYNYFNGISWNSIPDTTVEGEKSGWPSVAPFGESGEMIVSHMSTGDLILSKRINKGFGPWESDTLHGPEPDIKLCWPRLATSGINNEKIHIIALTYPYYPYHGQISALLYYRSEDGGNNWDKQHYLFPELNSDHYLGFSADCYSWAKPIGDTLAFAVGSRVVDLLVMKSTDGGGSWEKTIVWEHPYPFFDWNITITSDTVFCCDNSLSIALDGNGKVHLAFGCGIFYHPEVGSWWGYLPPQDGIGYWNEDMPVFSGTHDALKRDSLESTGNLIGWSQDIDGNGQVEFLDDYMYYKTDGICTMPYLAAGDHDDIYLVYSGLTELYDNAIYNYRHIWFRSSPDGGATWGNFTDLTGDLVTGFEEYVYPAIDYNNGSMAALYQEDPDPGLAWNEDHPFQENRIRYLDLNDYIIPPGGTVDKPERKTISIFPNPASDHIIIHSGTSVRKLTLLDGSGRWLKEYHLPGNAENSTVYFEFGSIPPGVYMLIADMDGYCFTEKIIVMK